MRQYSDLALARRSVWRPLLVVLAVLTCASGARASGIDSDSRAERALAEDKPKKDSLQTRWFNSKPAEPDPETEAPALTEAQHRALFPDLQVQTNASTPFKVSAGIIAPFQLFMVGLGADYYVLSRLRLNALASIGATFADPHGKHWEASFYAETGIGIAALRWQSSTTVTWPVPNREGQPSKAAGLRVIVPSSHSLEVEGGAMNGRAVLFRCTGNCVPQPNSDSTYAKASMQITMPYAGLRYVYFRRAWSASAHIGVKQRFQLAGDVIFPPFVRPAPDLVGVGPRRISRNRVGFRVMSQLPFLGCSAAGNCFGLDVGAGVLPVPAELFLTVSATVLWAERT
jgi:hypothetical protein